jgi:3-oxoacyl-[acyl-carrier protein] reductase
MLSVVRAAELFDLSGEVALVTGASSGLGARFAEVLAAQGAKVVLAARRIERLDACVRQIIERGGTATAVSLDVTDRTSIGSAFDVAERAWGPLTIVVNNAGVGAGTSFLDTDEAAWDRLQRVNVEGVWFVGQEAARRMVAHTIKGTIINVSSILGYRVKDATTAYSVGKAAVVHMTNAMAVDLAGHGIRVNGIAPGYFMSEMTDTFLASDAGKATVNRIPQRRSGQTSDFDGTLMLLASRKASAFMTGSTIVVDGGHLWSFT